MAKVSKKKQSAKNRKPLYKTIETRGNHKKDVKKSQSQQNDEDDDDDNNNNNNNNNNKDDDNRVQ